MGNRGNPQLVAYFDADAFCKPGISCESSTAGFKGVAVCNSGSEFAFALTLVPGTSPDQVTLQFGGTLRPTSAPTTAPPTTKPVFDPSSPLVSYWDQGACGPRGDDAEVDKSKCAAGAYIVEEVPMKNWQCVATINGCCYFAYTIYACKGTDAPT